MEIINPPAFLPPGPLKLLVAAVAHNVANALHQVVWTCVPEAPYEVLQYDSGFHYDTDGSTLNSGVTSSTTSLSVATTGATSAFCAVDDVGGDFPFTIIVDGEVMTVTNITGSSSPQSFTVTRSTNGVVKAHSPGVAVGVYRPPVWALT